MRPTGVSTTSSMGSRATCVMRCRILRSSASRVRLSSKPTPAAAPYSATTLASTTFSKAVDDGATVPIYYEGRLAKLVLDECERPKIDPGFEELTEGEEETRKERLKSKWAQLEAVAGADKRVATIAEDLVAHFEERLGAMEGKGLIVGMSRRICVDLYKAIIKLRPTWHSDDDASGHLKVVMTGSASDKSDWQGHIRSKGAREAIAKRFKDPDDPLK